MCVDPNQARHRTHLPHASTTVGGGGVMGRITTQIRRTDARYVWASVRYDVSLPQFPPPGQRLGLSRMEPGEAGDADDEFADGRAPRQRPGPDDLQFQETHIQDAAPVFADEVGRGCVGPVTGPLM